MVFASVIGCNFYKETAAIKPILLWYSWNFRH